MSGARIWTGDVLTKTDGSWSADISAAGCTTTPRVQADAISTGTTLALAAQAVIVARSTTAVSGYVNLPVTLTATLLPALAIGRAGAGVTVNVLVICT